MTIRLDAHRPEFHRAAPPQLPVRVATTANVTISTALNAGDSIDGVTLAAGDRVLVKDQSTGSQNGIYIAGATPARAFDFEEGVAAYGALIYVVAGTANGGTLWRNTNTTVPTIGSTALTFADYTPGGSTPSSLPWFVVTDYGAVGNDSTDDRTSINAAIADLNSAGRGVLYFPAGRYYVSNALTALTVPCLVLGDGSGMPGEGVSQIRTDHTTAILFTLSNYSITMRDLRLYNDSGSETAGAGVAVSTGFGAHNRYENLHIDGFRDGMSLIYGFEWAMQNCYITNPVRYGVHVANIDLPDGGDWSIVNSWFATRTRNATDAIHIESAGGGKIANVKINANHLSDQGGGVKKYVDGINLNLNGSANNTTVMTVVGSSIENVSGDAIDLSTTGTAQFGGVSISGLEVALYSNNSGRAVKLTAASAGGLGTAGGLGVVTLDGITAITDGTARAAIELTNTDSVSIGEMALKGFNARYTGSGDTNTVDGAAVSFATPAIVLGTAAAAGAATTVIRSDSTIVAFDATAPVTQAFGDAAATGSAAVAARRDHRHGMPASSGVGEILIVDTGASTPLIFADLLQNEAQDDLVYADP
jgi:hypothetical protein